MNMNYKNWRINRLLRLLQYLTFFCLIHMYKAGVLFISGNVPGTAGDTVTNVCLFLAFFFLFFLEAKKKDGSKRRQREGECLSRSPLK